MPVRQHGCVAAAAMAALCFALQIVDEVEELVGESADQLGAMFMKVASVWFIWGLFEHLMEL